MADIKFSKSYQHFGQQQVDVFIDEPVGSEKFTTEITLQKSFCSGQWDVCREGYFEVNPRNTSDGESVVWGLQFIKRDIGNLREVKRVIENEELDLAYVPGSHIRWQGLDVVTRKYFGKEKPESCPTK